MKKKTVKEVKMQKNLVCAGKSKDFAQSQKKFARSHDRETVTFRNSGPPYKPLNQREQLPESTKLPAKH